MINLEKQATLKGLLKNNPKVVLYFTAPWCGPCMAIGPMVLKLSKEYKDIIFIKLDVDECDPNCPIDYGVRSIPTIILLNNNIEYIRFIGLTPEQTIKNKLDELV